MTAQKILLVQHENSPLMVLKAALAKHGFEVTTCTTAFDALDEMRTEPADLVVTSAQLPDMSGFLLSSILKNCAAHGSVPVAIIGPSEEQDDEFWKGASCAELVIERQHVETNEEKAVDKLRKLLSSAATTYDKAAIVESPLLPTDTNGRDLLHSYKELLSVLLIERSVGRFCQSLVSSVGTRVEFMTRYFEFMKRMLHCDVIGLVVAGGGTPSGIYEFATPTSKSSFEKLQAGINKSLNAHSEPNLVMHGELQDKGGATIKSSELLMIRSADERLLGIVVVGWTSKHTLDAQERTVLEALKTQMLPVFRTLSDAHEIKLLQQAQCATASTDQTTGLYNLEFLVGFLQQQLLFSSRQKLPVGLTLIGVDRFSELNSTYGNAIGDNILAGLSKRISGSIRASDLLARYSGDQFALVLPNTDLKGSQTVAEKLRSEVESMPWPQLGAKAPKITVSVGCAAFNMQDVNPETILRDAKIALQSAKQSGRNCVSV